MAHSWHWYYHKSSPCSLVVLVLRVGYGGLLLNLPHNLSPQLTDAYSVSIATVSTHEGSPCTILIVELSWAQTLGVRCMALATRFSVASRKGVKGWGWGYYNIKSWGRANVHLYLHNGVQGSTIHSNNNPGMLYWTLHCSAGIKSTLLTVASDSWRHKLASSKHLEGLWCKPWLKTEVHWAVLHVQYYHCKLNCSLVQALYGHACMHAYKLRKVI